MKIYDQIKKKYVIATKVVYCIMHGNRHTVEKNKSERCSENPEQLRHVQKITEIISYKYKEVNKRYT